MSADNPSRAILAIDHGTSGIKAALVTPQGRVVDFEFEPTATRFLPRGGAEQDPRGWWRALVAATSRLFARGRIPANAVAAVGVSSTFSSTVAVDAAGDPIMSALTWMDSRGAPYVKRVVSGFPSFNGYGLTKIIPWIRKTGGGPQRSGKDDFAHVLFVRHEHPHIYEKTFKFLGSKDYLNLKLTGEFAATTDSITLFWVTDTRDIRRVRYDDGLIARLGIDREKLPALVASTDVIGTLRPAAAAELGLSEGVKVVGGSPDHQSALVGSGAVRDFEGHLYVGTSSWIECIVPFKKTDLLHSIASLPSAIPGKYQCINEQDMAGGCLAYLKENVFDEMTTLGAGEAGRIKYADLDALAANVPAGANGLIFTPWLNGERTPVDSTTLRGGFFNLSMTTSAADMVRAVLEGVAFNTRWSLGAVEKFVGRRMDPLNIIGGDGKSPLWCQILADVLGRTIRRVKDPIQANARGAAFIAAVGLGEIAFEDIPGLIAYEGICEPDSANRATYDRMHHEFLAIYKAMKGIYRRLND